MTTIRSSPDSTVSFLSNQEFGGEKWEEMEEAGWDYRQSAILGLAGDGYVIAPWLNKEISDKKNSKSISWLKGKQEGEASGFWM